MGVHESNAGLCEALNRAFESLQCIEHIMAAQNRVSNNCSSPSAVSQGTFDSQKDVSCVDLLRRLISRQCSISQHIRDSDWFESYDWSCPPSR